MIADSYFQTPHQAAKISRECGENTLTPDPNTEGDAIRYMPRVVTSSPDHYHHLEASGWSASPEAIAAQNRER